MDQDAGGHSHAASRGAAARAVRHVQRLVEAAEADVLDASEGPLQLLPLLRRRDGAADACGHALVEAAMPADEQRRELLAQLGTLVVEGA